MARISSVRIRNFRFMKAASRQRANHNRPGPQKTKPETQRDTAATKKQKRTTEPRSHGEKQKTDGFVPDRPDFALSKTRASIFRTYICASENRGHGNVAT